jgi:PST family polysaccharide transporter
MTRSKRSSRRRRAKSAQAARRALIEQKTVAPAQPPADAPPERGLRARTVSGMFWAYGSYVGGRLLVLLSTVVLARVLVPADFGVVALALTFMVFLDTVRDLGLGQALIVVPDERLASAAQTAFCGSLLLGAVLSGATALLASLGANFFDEPQLRGLLAVLGLNFFLRSFGATHLALARRALDFRSRTMSETCDVFVRGTVSIALALAGLGAWSLVLGYLAGTIAALVMIWVRVPWRPQRRISTTHLREMLSFGGILTLVDIGQAFAHEIDYLFIGRILGAAPLGLYSIAFRLPELLIINLSIVASTVLFPAYAKLDRERLTDAFLVSVRYTALVVLPVAVGLGILARPIVLTLFGDQWEEAIPVMQVLCLYAVVVTLNIPAGTVYKVTGRAWILIAFTVPYVILLAIVLKVLTPHGIIAVAGAMAGMQGAFAILGWTVATRILQVRPSAVGRTLLGPIGAAATMVVPLLAVEHLIERPLIVLVLGVPLAAASYLLGLHVFAGDALRPVLAMVRDRLPARLAIRPRERTAAGS